MEANTKDGDWEKQTVRVTACSAFWSIARLLEASNPKSTQEHLNDCFHPPLPSSSFHTAKHSNLLTWEIFQLLFLHSLRGSHQYAIAQKTLIIPLSDVSP